MSCLYQLNENWCIYQANLGASAARNLGLDESAAEHVLLLDDDVIPSRNLLEEYSEFLLQRHSEPFGCIGMTCFPPPINLHTQAVFLSDVTYMFGIAKILESPKWGVTANLLLRRSRLRFIEFPHFPKTGGGEDVDICLRHLPLCAMSPKSAPSFQSVPSAVVCHPWWNDGCRSFGHFFRWAAGDGILCTMDIHRCHVFTSWPNVAESILASLIAVGPISIAISRQLNERGCVSVLRVMALPMGIIIGEAMSDILKHNVFDRSRLPEVRGPRRVIAAAESSIVILCLETGRIYGHWCRGTMLRSFRRRFDWHCGAVSGARERERKAAFYKTISHLLGAVLLQLILAILS